MRERLTELAEAMGDSGRSAAAMAEYGALRERYDALDGDSAEDAALRLLERMGLGDRAFAPAAALSGGEKNTVCLARAKMGRPDLLILDEPGNHLDMAGLAWLEAFIAGLPCAVLVVSHDRRMLDRIASSIVELESRSLKRYAGNYSAYRLQKLRDAGGQGQRWQADKKKLERLEALVKKFEQIARARPDPAWGKRLRARRSQLAREKANATERPDIGSREAKVNFQGEASKADMALDVQSYSLAFGEKALFSDAGFTLLNGERVALVGPNGCGKTSFVRELISRGSWDSPDIRVGPSMRLGYCAQDQSVFDPEKTVEETFLSWLPTGREVFALLSTFMFGYDDLSKRCASLSGGELNRLQLARASALKANFLVLDEPTNHLDIPTREAVEDALEDFEGTVLVVSHDRYFLEKIAGRVVFIEERRFNEYEGSFGEYWRDVGSQHAARLLRKTGANGAVGLEDRARLRAGAGKATQSQTAGRLVQASDGGAELEAKISLMERRKEELERSIADAIDAKRFAESKRIASELDKHNRLLGALWERLMS
jgi:ATP-binding cassette subfamily F protein 3